MPSAVGRSISVSPGTSAWEPWSHVAYFISASLSDFYENSQAIMDVRALQRPSLK